MSITKANLEEKIKGLEAQQNQLKENFQAVTGAILLSKQLIAEIEAEEGKDAPKEEAPKDNVLTPSFRVIDPTPENIAAAMAPESEQKPE